MTEKLKILFVSSECAPYKKSGGLGDVMGALPNALRKIGVDARICIPKYNSINEKTVKGLKRTHISHVKLGHIDQYMGVMEAENLYFIENDFYFGREGLYGYGDDDVRFAFFCRAVLDMINLTGFYPDIIHVNDWQTGLLPVYLKGDFFCKLAMYKNIKTVFTIHNLQYQGSFPKNTLERVGLNYGYATSDKLEFYDRISFMKAGLTYSDYITTVSETYSHEIKDPYWGYRLDGLLRARENSLFGIINGIDTDEFNPKTDKRIYETLKDDTKAFKKANKTKLQEELNLPVCDAPLIGIVSRLADQKGFDLIGVIMEQLLNQNVQIALLGTGESRFEYMFRSYAGRYPHKISANITFDDTLATRIYSGSDFFLMPSLFEPCGLSQMYSLRYGTIPIVRRTGGLSDTVKAYNEFTKEGNGFSFDTTNPWDLYNTICYALTIYERKDLWDDLVRHAFTYDFSWRESAKKYIELYKKILG